MSAEFRVGIYFMLNLLSSVSVVMVNKIIYQYGFQYALTITFIHFVTTFLGLCLCALVNMFEVKKIALSSVLPVSISFCGFVALTNLSLRYNSVGVYQVFKILTSPVIVLINMLLYRSFLAPRLIFALAIVCAGATITSVTDFQVNLYGVCIASLATVVTSFYQIWVGTYQKDLQLNSMQLLLYQTPASIVMLIPLAPCIDDYSSGPESIFNYHMTAPVYTWLAISAVLAFLVNLSTFLVIGETSAITYNVLGHLKSCIIIVSGFLLFKYPVDPRNVAGIVITLFGVILYNYFKQQPPPKAEADKS